MWTIRVKTHPSRVGSNNKTIKSHEFCRKWKNMATKIRRNETLSGSIRQRPIVSLPDNCPKPNSIARSARVPIPLRRLLKKISIDIIIYTDELQIWVRTYRFLYIVSYYLNIISPNTKYVYCIIIVIIIIAHYSGFVIKPKTRVIYIIYYSSYPTKPRAFQIATIYFHNN